MTIIYLNGVSSAGKSSLAAALQQALDAPYAHVALDHFAPMVPKQGPKEDGEHWTGQAFFHRYALPAMHGCVAAFAAAGANVIVDQVLLEPAWFDDAVRRLQEDEVWFIGVQCALPEVERRERERGDRWAGQAGSQLQRTHAHGPYDLEIETTRLSPQEGALQITRRMHSGPPPLAFRQAAARATTRT